MLDQGKDPEVQLVENGAKKLVSLLFAAASLAFKYGKSLIEQQIQKRRVKKEKSALATEAAELQKMKPSRELSRGESIEKKKNYAMTKAAVMNNKIKQNQLQLNQQRGTRVNSRSHG